MPMALNKENILIVDDDIKILELLARRLKTRLQRRLLYAYADVTFFQSGT
mgnify:CR=1 FL=1